MTVKGIYKNGHVELKEAPPNQAEQEVLVTFPLATSIRPKVGAMIRRGMFAGTKEFTDEDFKAAEFHGDPDDGLDWS